MPRSCASMRPSGILGKKDKFRGIFRFNFAVKLADSALISWDLLCRFCGKIGRQCCGKSTALLLSAIHCTAKGRLLMESVSVSGISPSCKESKVYSFCHQIPIYGPRFLQSSDNKLKNQVY